MYVKKFTLVLMALSIVALSCLAESTAENGEGTVMKKNDNIAIKAEAVKDGSEMTVGFRIELVNSAVDKKLVLMISNNCAHQLTVDILNKEGNNISPRQELLPASESTRLKYYIVPPRGSGVWFIPVPNKTRKNLLKYNKDNLQPIPPGKYEAQIQASFSYFTMDDKNKDIPENPNYMSLRLVLPAIPIQVDSSIHEENIEQVYNKYDQDKKNIKKKE